MAGLGVTALETILPTGTTVYVAAYETEVSIVSETGTEVDDAGYARVAFDDWKTVVGATSVARTNNSAIVFPELVEGEKHIRWWAIWDAAVGGNLIACGPIRQGAVIADVAVSGGNQLRFDAEALQLIVSEGAE